MWSPTCVLWNGHINLRQWGHLDWTPTTTVNMAKNDRQHQVNV